MKKVKKVEDRARKVLIGVRVLATVLAVVGAACGTTPATSSRGDRILRLLVWEGYANDEWVKPFEDRYDVDVVVTYMGSDDEQFAKMRAGGGTNYDLVSPNQANLPLYRKEGLIAPIDESRLKNYANVIPELRDLRYRLEDGKLWGAPYVWGANPLMYNPAEIDTPPTSWNDLWDPKYKGKVIMPDDAILNTSVAALALGFSDPFNLTDDQLEKVKEKLLELKPNILTYYTGFGDAANLMASGEAVIGMSIGSLIVKQAADQGTEIVETVPKEGAISWLDTWAITKGGENKLDLVYDWLNYTLTPEVQAQVVEANQFGGVVDLTGKVDPSLLKITHMDDPSFLASLIPQVLPESIEKRQEIFNEVKTAGA
jgi:putative spermidine/putrescine transport system substrate-binding protein/spermidine/putrescine transport system substrate-binding protein